MRARAPTLERVLDPKPFSGTRRHALTRCRVQSPRATHGRGSERAAPRHLVFRVQSLVRTRERQRRACPPQRRVSHSFRCRTPRQDGSDVAPAFVHPHDQVPPGDTWRIAPWGWGDQWSRRSSCFWHGTTEPHPPHPRWGLQGTGSTFLPLVAHEHKKNAPNFGAF
jgi:hypothetical protein